MELNYEFTFEPIINRDIETFEQKYQVHLPENYKKFLLLNNGGKSVKRRFKTADGIITSSVMLFLPLSKETDSNLESFYEKYCVNKIIPINLIPIGIDPADSLICISQQGEVYYCDMDYFEEDNELKMEYVKLITENFTVFLQNLYTL